jgi:hypothetical protein
MHEANEMPEYDSSKAADHADQQAKPAERQQTDPCTLVVGCPE